MARTTRNQTTRDRDCDALVVIGAQAQSRLYERYLHEAHFSDTFVMWLSRIAD